MFSTSEKAIPGKSYCLLYMIYNFVGVKIAFDSGHVIKHTLYYGQHR